MTRPAIDGREPPGPPRSPLCGPVVTTDSPPTWKAPVIAPALPPAGDLLTVTGDTVCRLVTGEVDPDWMPARAAA